MTNHNPYMTREGGATVTVFVPYDCKNHCPFCINKQEYQNPEGFSVEKVCESIRMFHEITPKCDFVFTGGEPFSEPDALQVMMDCIPEGHRVFINTTLPVSDLFPAERIIAFTERNKDKITCINISRHMVHYVEECNDELLGSLKVPVRINCVLFKNYPHDGMIAFANRFAKYGLPIQFRADYTITTPENLYKREGDQILADLMKNFEYLGLDGCRIRCGYDTIAIHRQGPLTACRPVTARPYPGFPTDAMPVLLAAQLGAQGKTSFTETIFENRFLYVQELQKLGAKLSQDGRTVRLQGAEPLHAARLHAGDLRGGAALVLGAMQAEGESTIFGVKHIQRGYDNLEAALQSAGARLKTVEIPIKV